MTTPVHYATATAFRQALETRLLKLARTEGVDIQRLRRQVAFDRLLCRLFQSPGETPWALKGGYAMELRLASARTTRDIDLAVNRRFAGDKKLFGPRVLEMLQVAATADTADYFLFRIGEPISDLNAAPYGGGRFPVDARLDGRTFAKFHLDVGFGDIVMEPLEVVHGRDWLGFARIPPLAAPAISCEQQFAEKYHAYTLPRPGAPNSRVRDLVDMLLLIRNGAMDRGRTQDALRLTFGRRHTHPMPKDVPLPPDNWEKPFVALTTECGLKVTFGEAHTLLRHFLTALGRDTRT